MQRKMKTRSSYFVVGELIDGEQTADQSNVDLEGGHFAGLEHKRFARGSGSTAATNRVDLELSGDPVARLDVELVEPGEIDRVETVDDRDAQGVRSEDVRPVARLRDRPVFVRAPRVLGVVGERVDHHLDKHKS
jgi:hypothetical protein